MGGGRFTRPTLSTSPFFRARAESLLPPLLLLPRHSHPLGLPPLLSRPIPPLPIPILHPHRQSLQNGKYARLRRAVHLQTAPAATTSYARRRAHRARAADALIVSATERKAGAPAVAASVTACD
jgi:hypothetical protein